MKSQVKDTSIHIQSQIEFIDNNVNWYDGNSNPEECDMTHLLADLVPDSVYIYPSIYPSACPVNQTQQQRKSLKCPASNDTQNLSSKIIKDAIQYTTARSIKIEDGRIHEASILSPSIQRCLNCNSQDCTGSELTGGNGLYCSSACALNCKQVDCHSGKINGCITYLQGLTNDSSGSQIRVDGPQRLFWRPYFLKRASNQDIIIPTTHTNKLFDLDSRIEKKIVRHCRNCGAGTCFGSCARGRRGLGCQAECSKNCGILGCHGGLVIKCISLSSPPLLIDDDGHADCDNKMAQDDVQSPLSMDFKEKERQVPLLDSYESQGSSNQSDFCDLTTSNDYHLTDYTGQKFIDRPSNDTTVGENEVYGWKLFEDHYYFVCIISQANTKIDFRYTSDDSLGFAPEWSDDLIPFKLLPIGSIVFVVVSDRCQYLAEIIFSNSVTCEVLFVKGPKKIRGCYRLVYYSHIVIPISSFDILQ